MSTPVYEIDHVQLGIFSAEELLKLSVVEVNSPKPDEGEDGQINYTPDGRPMAGLYDERMGCRLDRTTACVTCGQNPEQCPGHFGHIALNVPLIHPHFGRHIHNFLKCFCTSAGCGKLLVSQEHLELWGIAHLQKGERFAAVLDRLSKVDICLACGHPQPTIKFDPQELTYHKFHKQKDTKVGVEMTVDEIKDIFDFIPPASVRLLGFDPKMVHPKDMILTVFPVIPICARPFVIADGNRCNDDLTVQLAEIIKQNNNLHPHVETDDKKRARAMKVLKFRIETMFDNDKGKAKDPVNNRPIKGIKERLQGKDGQVRSHLMGKRVEFSARTVITANPLISSDTVGVPDYICRILTFPEVLTERNRAKLEKLVAENQANFIRRQTPTGEIKFPIKRVMYLRPTPLLYGDKVVRKLRDREVELTVLNNNVTLQPGDRVIRNGEEIQNVTYPKRKPFALQVGDIIDRHLQNGDTILINRQPTLHKGSMLAMKVQRHPYKTLQLSLAVTKTFNADERQRQQQGA